MTDYLDPDYTVLNTNNIVYNTNASTNANSLNLYRPSEAITTRRPLLIWTHGGGFSSGTKDNSEAVLICQYFAARGYKAVSIDYRLLSYENCVRDIKAAIRWARQEAATYGFNTDIIIVGGDSAGALASYGSIANPALEELNGNNAFFGQTKANALLGCWGPYLDVASTVQTPYSTAINVGDLAIAFLVHGSRDIDVFPGHTDALACAIRRRSVITTRVYKQILVGGEHSAWIPTATAQGFYNTSVDVMFPHFRNALNL